MTNANASILRVPPSRTWNDWQEPKRIVCRIPNWVGDVVMATPALRALKKGIPGAEIWVEGRPHLRAIVEDLPYVDHFLADPGKGLANTRERIRQLKQLRFDMAVLFPDSPRSAFAPFMAGIPMRLGYGRSLLRRAMLTHRLYPQGEDRRRVPISMIDRNLVLTRALGLPDDGDQMDVPIANTTREAARKLLVAAGVDLEQPICVVIPGASFGASKLWPVEHFATTLDRLHYQDGLQTVIPTGPSEKAIAHGIASAMQSPCFPLTDPVFSLAEVAALVERSQLVISNDTGPRQFGVALGIPTVVPIGPTDHRSTNHHLARQKVLFEPVDCRPCGLKKCPTDHRCMTRITPEQVVAAAREMMEIPQ